MTEDFTFLSDESKIRLKDGTEFTLDHPKAFEVISDAWLRSGWDTKYVYSFSWLGRPIIQLPEDMIRIQEVIYEIKPDVIIETGIAHGGSLIFYASILNALGKGRVIGIDIEIRPHNKEAIIAHDLYKYITLYEGSSVDKKIFNDVKSNIKENEKVLVILDSNHLKEHVYEELKMYSNLVSNESYIVACDGIMKEVCGAPRTAPEWEWNNPISAIEEFIENNKDFKVIEPKFPFNEGQIKNRVTYWPKAFLKRID